MSALTKMAKISKNRQIRQASDFALTKIRQNRQFCQADFTLTNWTKTRQNRQIHGHSLGLTEFHFFIFFHFLLRTFLDLSGFARLVNNDVHSISSVRVQ